MFVKSGLMAIGATLALAGTAAALSPIPDLENPGGLALRLDGSLADERSATALATGDANGDGRGDLLVGAPGEGTMPGVAYLVLGTTSLTNVPDLDNPPAGITVLRYGGVSADRLGTSVALSDVTSDAKDDLIIGAPGASPLGRLAAGSVFVIPGSAAPADDPDLSTLPAGGVRIDGALPGDQTGLDVDSGDVMGTAARDVLIGAPFADGIDGVDAGTAYVVPGGAGLAGTLDLAAMPAGAIRFDGPGANTLAGYDVAAGDFLGSSKADVVIGVPLADTGTLLDTGRVYIIPGDVALAGDPTLSTTPPGTQAWYFPDPGAQAGRSLAIGQWIPGGQQELAFGAPFADANGVDSGGAAVVGDNFLWATYAGDNAGDAFGWDLAFGDLTGSSADELLAGAPSAAPGGRLLAGRAYVIPGGAPSASDIGTGPPGTLTYDGVLADDALGSTVAAGDLNGDLRADGMLGAERADRPGRPDTGSTYVLIGDNAAPTAALAVAPTTVEVGDNATWTASGTDPEGGPLEWSFDIDGLPGFEFPFSGTTQRTRNYLAPGTITGRATARDVGGATATASAQLTVTAGSGATTCAPGTSTIVGTGAANTLSGGYGSQIIIGLGGGDTIEGGYDNDCLFGNGGPDTVDGGYGDDYVSGGAGNDILKGGYGNDLLNAEDGSGGDTVNCGANVDTARVDPGDSVSGCETVT